MQDSKFELTTWHNPLKVPQKCRIYHSPGNWQTFEVPPGEERQLDTRLDVAIQEINEDGVIVAGLCPMLVRVGSSTSDGPTPRRTAQGKIVKGEAKVHESLDPANAERKSAQERLAEVQLEELLAEKAKAAAEARAEAAKKNAEAAAFEQKAAQHNNGRK